MSQNVIWCPIKLNNVLKCSRNVLKSSRTLVATTRYSEKLPKSLEVGCNSCFLSEIREDATCWIWWVNKQSFYFWKEGAPLMEVYALLFALGVCWKNSELNEKRKKKISFHFCCCCCFLLLKSSRCSISARHALFLYNNKNYWGNIRL